MRDLVVLYGFVVFTWNGKPIQSRFASHRVLWKPLAIVTIQILSRLTYTRYQSGKDGRREKGTDTDQRTDITPDSKVRNIFQVFLHTHMYAILAAHPLVLLIIYIELSAGRSNRQ